MKKERWVLVAKLDLSGGHADEVNMGGKILSPNYLRY
jgi:hypothetical protein